MDSSALIFISSFPFALHLYYCIKKGVLAGTLFSFAEKVMIALQTKRLRRYNAYAVMNLIVLKLPFSNHIITLACKLITHEVLIAIKQDRRMTNQ